MAELETSIEAQVPEGLAARWAFQRELSWRRRRQHFGGHGPGFRDAREAAVALGFARYVWSWRRGLEWLAWTSLALLVLWFLGEWRIAVEDTWPLTVLLIGGGLELYRARRLADRATTYLEHRARETPAHARMGVDQGGAEPSSAP